MYDIDSRPTRKFAVVGRLDLRLDLWYHSGHDGELRMDRFDVLGLGCVSLDELLYVDAYPPADAKARVLRRELQCRGLTAAVVKATCPSGQAGIPSRVAVESFLKERHP